MTKMGKFKEDLVFLLNKYSAEIDIQHDGSGEPYIDVWIQGHFCDEAEYVSLNEEWKRINGEEVIKHQ